METLELQSELLPYDAEQRFRDDTTTWLAEVLDGSMRTPFSYNFDGKELYSHDGGALKPIFLDAIADAKDMAKENPVLSFELRRRQTEYEEYQSILDMARGEAPNTMVVVSDFPSELMTAQKDVAGYNTARKQTMLRVITRTAEGNIVMRSQSLDGSDRRALEAIYQSCGIQPQPGELLGQRILFDTDEVSQEFMIDKLMGVYDRQLEARYGGSWYAGRQDAKRINTYDFVCSQSDLIDGFIKLSAGKPSRLHFRNIAAAMDARFRQTEQSVYRASDVVVRAIPNHVARNIYEEMEKQGSIAESKGRVFSGCGMSIGPSDKDAPDQLEELGYGNKLSEDKYGSLKFDCPKGHTNTRPRNQLIERCKTCGTSVKC